MLRFVGVVEKVHMRIEHVVELEPSLGGGRRHFYAVPTMPEFEALDSVIAGTITVCHQPTFSLTDLGSTYFYVSVYFAP